MSSRDSSGDRSRTPLLLTSSDSITPPGFLTVKKRAYRILAGCLMCLSPIGMGALSCNPELVTAQDSATAASSVATLVESLDSDDPAERWKVARELGRLGPAAQDALPSLLSATNDNESSVRKHAIVALGRIGDGSPDVIEGLIKAVGDPDSGNRIAAANSLRELVDDPEVLVPIAVSIMEKEHPLFASRLVETIVMRGERAVPFLNAALKNDRAAYWACIAIEEIGESAAPTVPALVELLKGDPEDDVKVQAILALAKIGPAAKVAQPQIMAALENTSNQSIQTAAAFAAGALGFVDATANLESSRDSDEPLLSLVSYWALAKLHPGDAARLKAAVDQLVSSLSSDDASLRLAAAKGLQSLPVDPEVLGPKLIEVLNDSDPVVAHNLVDALASLGEPAAEKAANALSNEEMRELAVAVLEELGDQAKPAMPSIVSALATAEGEFRNQLQTVVGQIGPDAASATDELIRSLDDGEESIRIGALFALGNIGPCAAAAAAKVVSVMEETDEPFEKLLAAWTISKISPSDEAMAAKVVPVLIEGLRFPDGRVQAEAITALGSLGSAASAAADELTSLANNESAPDELRELAKQAASAVK
ncbi:HEAT repeat domain-containing protein [Aporhodopirellula rubra]|uniref:HEAT repeat domain-containing protein n=1 Tax=Aporhodopirellula rubra TaxID=980271 RepID=UPI001FEA688A|nr:HEAT repeat domain-containing protein [Aporhodopirellula rubra]